MDDLLALGLVTAAAAVGLALILAIARQNDDDPWDPSRWRGDD